MVEILLIVARLIENATSDDYDKQKELEGMLALEKAIYDARMKALLHKK